MDQQSIEQFVSYVKGLKGREKSEAQYFIVRLLELYEHREILDKGEAFFEENVKVEGKTKWMDFLWPGHVLIEMKSKGEDLSRHFSQAKTYWDNAYGKRTEYVVLCNFDELWVYNWNKQKEPLDKLRAQDIPQRYRVLSFLSKTETPLFGNDLEAVTKEAAATIAELYKSLRSRDVEENIAQRFTLQCLLCLFADDTGLFPVRGFVYGQSPAIHVLLNT